ncbi:zinc ABC transporter substrate-binding protein [bacterium]|nr:zinc ABC transporter substrate-binding protein [bacterium]
MVMDRPAIVALVMSAALLGGCTKSPTAAMESHLYSGSYPIKVVVSTGMVGDIVREVGGDKVEVFQLMGEGVDPHLYKASPGDIDKLDNADFIMFSGLHLEGKLSEILERLNRRKPTHAVADTLDKSKLLADPDGIVDPHIWFDVQLWRSGVAGVAETLGKFDRKNKEYYTANAAKYEAKLDALDKDVTEKLKQVPDNQRVLVTAHDAFGYFARAYGLKVRSIQGISTDAEAGLREINDLVQFICDNKINAVFVESTISGRNVRSLIEGCKAKGHEVVIGGELYSDALGKAGSPEGDYIGMVRHNVDVLVNSLK